jgi:hypothetical protein
VCARSSTTSSPASSGALSVYSHTLSQIAGNASVYGSFFGVKRGEFAEPLGFSPSMKSVRR